MTTARPIKPRVLLKKNRAIPLDDSDDELIIKLTKDETILIINCNKLMESKACLYKMSGKVAFNPNNSITSIVYHQIIRNIFC